MPEALRPELPGIGTGAGEEREDLLLCDGVRTREKLQLLSASADRMMDASTVIMQFV